MATESKDVELRVRARDFSRKTLDGVTNALDELSKAQKAQLDGAKKGEVSAKALADSYDKIENAVKALIQQNALTKVFEAQAAALELAKDKADAARATQTAYANSLAGVEQQTKKQIAAQETLAKKVAGADAAQLNAQTRLDRTVAKLAEFGIASDKIGVAQRRMADGVALGNAALDQQQHALDNVEAHLAAKAAADSAAAAAAKKNAADQAAALKQVGDAAASAAAQQAKNSATAQAFAAKRVEQIQAERAVTAALRASAEQADASAKGYVTLARSIKSVRGDELANQLRSITDPSGVANSNLQGLEATIGKLNAKVAAINGPVKEFRATLRSLEETQKGLVGIGAQIDAYKRQIDVLRVARTEYDKARTAVRALSEAMRTGGGDAATLSSQMNAAQGALRSAASNMANQRNAARDLRTELNAAGVDTRKLGEAEAQLVNQAKTATSAVERLSAAYKQNGAAAEGAAAKQFKFFDGTRTTLSFAQRLRGELLALATAYIGVQGAIGTATGALDAFKTSQKIQGQLGAAFGNDAAVIRREWEWLMAAANRIGISFREAAPAYAKFAIAATSFGLSGDEIRFIFEKIAGASRVAGLSASEFEGVMKAVEQSFSKGTIQAEELRGQLGDRLPGAFTIMARSLGVSTAELGKSMEQSGEKADAFINFARELPKTFKATEAATNGLTASQARFNNALFEFQLAIANSGFADAFTKLLIQLTTLMNSTDGKKFAETLSKAFTLVVQVFGFFAANIDLVKDALIIMTGVKIVQWSAAAFIGIKSLFEIFGLLLGILRGGAAGIAVAEGAMVRLGVAGAAAAGGVGLFRTGIMLLLRTLPGLGLLVIAIEAAAKAYQFMNREKAKASTGGATGSWDTPNTGGATGSWDSNGPTPDPGTGGTASKRAAAGFDKDAEARQKKLDEERKSAMKKSAKDELDERAGLIKDQFKLIRDNAARTITDKEELSKRLLVLDKQEKQALLTDRIKFDAEHAKAGQSAANKEIGLKEQVKNELLRIEDDLAKDAAAQDKSAPFDERKQTRIDAIAHAYDKLKKTIVSLSALDKKAADEAGKKLDQFISQRQAIEEIKVTSEEVVRLEKELNDQQSLRTSALEKQKTLYDAGIISKQEFLANTADINTRTDTAVGVAAKNLQDFVDAAVKVKPGILSLTQQADISVKTTRAQIPTAKITNDDALNKAQVEAIDALVAKRSAAEAIYKAQFDLRMITEDQYAAKVNENGELYKSQILAQNEALLAQLEMQRAQGILEGTLNVERLAALDAMIAKYELLGVNIANSAKQTDFMQASMNSFVSQGVDTGLSAVVDNLNKMASEQESVSQGFGNMLQSALAFFAQFLMQIAQAIAKQMLLNALASMGGVWGAAGKAAGGVASAAVHHTGGIVGSPNGRTRSVSPSWFVDAPRFHDGGLPGLRQDETAAILQKGEQVLARDDPNNILNGGGQAASKGVRFVLVDDRSKIPEAMSGADGGEVVIQHIRRNSATIKQMLKS